MYFTDVQKNEYLEKLQNNAVLAFPTDTVWGIGCLPNNQTACEKIYSIKKRDGNKPLILLGESINDFEPFIENFPALANDLSQKFWPGALTIIVKKSTSTKNFVTSGLNSVGLRIPNHPVLLELLKYTGPLATTSANLSGESAALNKTQALNYIGEQIDFLIEDFEIPAQGTESTVILIENDTYKVLRQGAINL